MDMKNILAKAENVRAGVNDTLSNNKGILSGVCAVAYCVMCWVVAKAAKKVGDHSITESK